MLGDRRFLPHTHTRRADSRPVGGLSPGWLDKCWADICGFGCRAVPLSQRNAPQQHGYLPPNEQALSVPASFTLCCKVRLLNCLAFYLEATKLEDTSAIKTARSRVKPRRGKLDLIVDFICTALIGSMKTKWHSLKWFDSRIVHMLLHSQVR